LLSNDLWLNNARHANAMAQHMAQGLRNIKSIHLTQPVDANAIFAIMPTAFIEKLQTRYSFYVWNEHLSEVRLMTSFDTKKEEIDAFVRDAQD
jgi:threonine aldolase